MTHGFFFFLKRAHHAGLKLMRGLLLDSGLTPARFDMLEAFKDLPYISQRDLRKELGVSRTTVSRMVRALVERGILTRSRSGDARTWTLKISAFGREILRIARAAVVDSGAAVAKLKEAVLHGRDPSDWLYPFDELQTSLYYIRKVCGDTATMTFSWHPDD